MDPLRKLSPDTLNTTYMHRQWMNEWIDGWMDGWMDEWMMGR